MRSGEVAAEAAVNIQTLRYYERVGLVPKPERGSSGYRAYDRQVVRRVRFIKRAQELGFTLAEIGDLLAFREETGVSCERVETRASTTVERISEKIRDLEKMRSALSHYVTACRSRVAVAQCPLLDALDKEAE